MRVHAILDDALVREAERAFPELPTRTALLEEGLRALLARRAALELADWLRHGVEALDDVNRRRPPGLDPSASTPSEDE